MKRGSCNELGYDPQQDFYKFLEEARKHAIDFNFSQDSSLPSPASVAKPVAVEAAKSSKKSWRKCLSSWWKLNKKKSSTHEAVTLTDGSRVPTKRSSSVSGPIFGRGGRLGLVRRPTSGPLAECFTPTRVEENELPYVCLSQHKCSSGVQGFGPIYLVT